MDCRQIFFDFRTETKRNVGDTENIRSFRAAVRFERVITLLVARSWRRAVARLTVLSRSSRKILSSTARRAGESARSARGLRARKVILSFCCVAEIFQRPSPIRSPITFIDRPALSRTFSNRTIFLDRGERGTF